MCIQCLFAHLQESIYLSIKLTPSTETLIIAVITAPFRFVIKARFIQYDFVECNLLTTQKKM